MKLKVYNKDNAASTSRTSAVTFRFYAKGVLGLSKGLRQQLNLTPGDGIEVAQDEDEPTDWYIKKSKDGIVTRLAAKSDPDGALLCNTAKVSHALEDSLQVEKGVMLVGKEPNEDGWYPIFTSSLK